MRLAQDLAAAGDLKGAEAHFVDAGRWREAVDMYIKSGSWEDALRVAKVRGGTAAHDQVRNKISILASVLLCHCLKHYPKLPIMRKGGT